MAHRVKSLWICSHCGGRLSLMKQVDDQHGRTYCDERCRRNQLKLERKLKRRKRKFQAA